MQKGIRQLFGILLFTCLSANIFAQASVSLDVDNHPTPQLALWADRTEIATLTVENTDPELENTDYIIKTKMFLDDHLVLETNNDVVVQTFEIGTQTFMADEIIPYSALVFHDNNFQQHLMQTGMLPPGNYYFCVTLLNLAGTIVSDPGPICEPMTITEYDMPQLLSPSIQNNENKLVESDLVPDITFSWTPLSPDPPVEDGVKYIIAVMEIYDYQTPGQAFHVNYPIFEEEVMGTEFVWPTDLDAPTDSTGYVWSVKPISNDENTYHFGNNGFVNPATFSIKPNEDIELDACACTNGEALPELTITQPEPMLNPRKLELNGVLDLVTALFDCNDNISDASHTMTTTISWDTIHDAESIINNGPFIHQYSETHGIPEEICVHINVMPKPGYNGGQCDKVFCVDVPQSIQDLNVANTATGEVSSNDTIYAGQDGEFAVALSELTGTSSSYSGEGTVYVDWLNAPINVEFQGITIDTDKHLLTGVIKARRYEDGVPQFPADMVVDAANTGNWTNNLVDTLVQWMDAQGTIVIDKNGPAFVADPISVPFGLKFQSDDTLAITEFIFEPNKSEFTAIARKKLEGDWAQDQTVGFKAKNIHFHPTQIVTPMERLELIEDITVGNLNGEINFTFKKPTNPTTGGCYIQWNENGFDHFGIEVDANFTRDWVIPTPDPDTTKRVSANFVGVASAWDDIILTGNLPQCEFVDSDSMTLAVSNIVMDLSDLQNPAGIVFPENYPQGAETSNLFHGFFVQSSTLTLPKRWETHSGGPPAITVQNLIINHTGVTFYAEATNVKQFPEASVADLGVSIDTVYIDMVTNTITEAGVIGQIGLPIADGDSMQNPLEYLAIFNNSQDPTEQTNFELTIEPTGPIYANTLKGELTLEPTSHIIAYVDKNKRTFESNLTGDLLWDDKQIGPVKHINFDIGFENITFNYNSSLADGNKMLFEPGHWTFASPQKFVADFPVSIERIYFTPMNVASNQYLHGNLNMDLVFNLTQDIGGRSTMGVEFAVDKNTSTASASKFKPQYKGINISTIDVYAHLAAVSIDGSIAFRNDDPVWGNGFKGSLDASFRSPSIAISALGEFGKTNYQHYQKYRYWRVEATAMFQPGIPFLPGVAFYGFGGGAYKNMEASIAGTSYTFTPHYGNWGFRVKGVIGTTPSPKAFNADVGLMGQFSSSGGLVNVGFTGDFFVGGPLTPANKRNKAQIKGSVIADYNFPDKHFYMYANVGINKPPVIVANNQTFVLDIQGKTNDWYVKFGEPAQTNDVSVFGINLYSYLMCGNAIDAPVGGFTQRFKDNYSDVFGYSPGIPDGTGVDDNSATGKGFALGIGMDVDKSVNKNITGNYYIDLGIAAGAEVDLSMMEYTGQNCANPSQRVGLNGYRARGSIGFYASAGAQVQKKNGSGNVVNTWNIAQVKAGGWLDGRFPRPTYVTGAVDGDVKIGHYTTKIHLLGDCKKCGGAYHVEHSLQRVKCVHYQDHYLLNHDFHASFEWGDNCGAGDNQAPVTSGSTYDEGDAAADQQQKLIQYVHPLTQSHFPLDMPIAVKYGLPVNESFDVSEQQADGSILNRTFKLEATVSMTESTYDGVGTTILVKKDKNNLGEHLYTKSIPVSLTMSSINLPPIGHSGANSSGTTSSTGLASKGSGQSSTNNTNSSGSHHGGATIIVPPVTMTMPPITNMNTTPPPPPAPVVNNLESNRIYRITITATLKEYKNNQWQPALKRDGTPVNQTVIKTFFTGPVPMTAPAANATN